MNVLDLVVTAVVVFSVVTGFRRGAALQLVTYTGLFIGLLAGALLAPVVAGFIVEPFGQAVIALTTLLLLAAIGDAIGWMIGKRVWIAARRSVLDPVDQAAGSVVAGVAVLLAVWFLAFNLVQGPFPTLARQIRGSAVVRGIDTVLPRPPAVLSQVRQFLNRFGFPDVFADLPPAPAGPVQGPSRGEVGRAFRAADESTVKIVGEACGRIQEGSGFVVEPNYVVTNAHVVAGVDAPQVQQQGGATFDATTVLFDDDLDLAVLRVGSAPGPDLDLLQGVLDRGAVGAVLGYPRGGNLQGDPAAVRQTLSPLGYDIYNDDTVRREVYELQAPVQPGNSGGPFVTPDGQVAGVVFAASTTNDGVGYALTSEEVLPRVRQALGSTREVDTGPCIR
ncbi:MAG TPA: MarP family serine protease [Actinomycetota bacterium]|nr:MarP family serine protease [Actinomycetota bacterium]